MPALLFKIVTPETLNDDIHVVTLFNVAFPDIFNVDENVAGVFKLINVGGFNIAL